MDEIPSIEIYNAFREEIQAIFRSRLQSQVLFALSAGNKTLSVLREITGSSSQALIPKIRQLESAGYVESVRGEYALTPIGKVLIPDVEQLVRLIGVIHRHRDFWMNHDIESIPPDLLRELGDLYSSTVARDLDENILHVYQAFVKILDEAAWVHGVTSITSPTHAEAIGRTVLRGTPVELVISEDLAHKLLGDPFSGMREQLADMPHLKFFVSSLPVRLGMTVTDRHLSLGLYKRGTDVYDVSFDLVSDDPSAVAWGERLFQYFRKNSKEMRYER
jgi:predicted transcriptional regulator